MRFNSNEVHTIGSNETFRHLMEIKMSRVISDCYWFAAGYWFKDSLCIYVWIFVVLMDEASSLSGIDGRSMYD